MGELLDIPEWLALAIWVIGALSIWLAVGFFMHKRGQQRLAAKRANPTRAAFVAMLASDIDPDIAEWFWEQLQPYYIPLTPHPDDHLLKDAMIDDDDIGMDWWPMFARAKGLDERRSPDWPEEWDLTVFNFARWLQVARDQQCKLR